MDRQRKEGGQAWSDCRVHPKESCVNKRHYTVIVAAGHRGFIQNVNIGELQADTSHPGCRQTAEPSRCVYTEQLSVILSCPHQQMWNGDAHWRVHKGPVRLARRPAGPGAVTDQQLQRGLATQRCRSASKQTATPSHITSSHHRHHHLTRRCSLHLVCRVQAPPLEHLSQDASGRQGLCRMEPMAWCRTPRQCQRLRIRMLRPGRARTFACAPAQHDIPIDGLFSFTLPCATQNTWYLFAALWLKDQQNHSSHVGTVETLGAGSIGTASEGARIAHPSRPLGINHEREGCSSHRRSLLSGVQRQRQQLR